MGHGDRFVLSDANFPSYSHNSTLIRLDGLNIPQAAKAILSVFPLDSFIVEPVIRMEIDGKPEEINEVHHLKQIYHHDPSKHNRKDSNN